jgi:hypothetical protein
MTELSDTELLPRDHAVSFYDHDSDVVGEVAYFILDGLAVGDRVVVVATPAHRAAIEAVLLRHGHDPEALGTSGRYVALDARATLAGFMDDGVPDADRFRASLGPIVDSADGSRVRVFGEMVALLWDDGNVAAAVQLEGLWNSLRAGRDFALLCAYPASALRSGSLGEATSVCHLHSSVTPPPSYGATATAQLAHADGLLRASEVYLPVPSAIPATRRFVATVLGSWQLDQLVEDAQLITSELATNALNHALSAFRVRLQCNDDSVRIAIQDIALTRPERQQIAVDSFGGRGVSIVEMTATSWGCELVDEGKEVWAELNRPAV